MAAGKRRFGKPRTNNQRRVIHTRIYGANSPLPKRDSGLKERK